MRDRDIAAPTKPHKGAGMEGFIASWYARQTAHDLDEFQRIARRIAAYLNSGDRVLEIAPGPGYLAIALAKLTDSPVTGLDISKSFVRMAAEMRAKPMSASISSMATPLICRFPIRSSISLSAARRSRISPGPWSQSMRCTACSNPAGRR